MVSQYRPSEEEDARLVLQNRLLDTFDGSVYRKILSGLRTPVTVLDVGCGTGDMLIPRLAGLDFRYLGIDKSLQQIEKGRQKHTDGRFSFRCLDIENESIGPEKFSLINISMALLHMGDPQKVLQALHPCLEEDGRIIIRDIDDGLNFAWPDPDDFFPRIYRIAAGFAWGGDRHSGRKIFSCLEKAGYSTIELRRQGLSTAGLDREQKETFYQMSIRLILDMAEKSGGPDGMWVSENRDTIYRQFMREDFFTSLGFMTYTASK